MDNEERRKSNSQASTTAFSTQQSLSALPDELARRLDLVDQVITRGVKPSLLNMPVFRHASESAVPQLATVFGNASTYALY